MIHFKRLHASPLAPSPDFGNCGKLTLMGLRPRAEICAPLGRNNILGISELPGLQPINESECLSESSLVGIADGRVAIGLDPFGVLDPKRDPDKLP
jgi:hypothetical protein